MSRYPNIPPLICHRQSTISSRTILNTQIPCPIPYLHRSTWTKNPQCSTDISITHLLSTVTEPIDLIDFAIPDHVLLNPEESVKRAILAPTNAQVDNYNSIILDRIGGGAKAYLAADSIKEADDIVGLPPGSDSSILDYTARRTPPGLSSHSLTIKVGGIYHLLHNIAPERGCVKKPLGCNRWNRESPDAHAPNATRRPPCPSSSHPVQDCFTQWPYPHLPPIPTCPCICDNV
ncbi:hypothetical protein FRB93_002468 [Tulasnella sp. JGI-2019a]|nr:hypothetical protein FRB93_002468 [Tulasnella sp. JGI-2019a]